MLKFKNTLDFERDFERLTIEFCNVGMRRTDNKDMVTE